MRAYLTENKIVPVTYSWNDIQTVPGVYAPHSLNGQAAEGEVAKCKFVSFGHRVYLLDSLHQLVNAPGWQNWKFVKLDVPSITLYF